MNKINLFCNGVLSDKDGLERADDLKQIGLVLNLVVDCLLESNEQVVNGRILAYIVHVQICFRQVL
jgi:hypothetical protein